METLPNSEEAISGPSTLSPEASPARISVKQEDALESRAIARAFGLSSPVSLGNWAPDGCSLKTFQVCLTDGQCQEFSENWPDSGMWDAGSAYELQTSALPTYENESLSWPAERWPTALREDGESAGNHPGATDSLTGITKLWRTPDAPNSGGPRNRQGSVDQGHQFTIAEQAEHWNTPHGMSNRDKTGKLSGCGGAEFGKQANNWQTPAADSFRSRGGDRIDEMGLDQQARMFPTPSQRDYRTPNKQSYQERSQSTKGEQLSNFVAHSLQDQATPDGPKSSESSPGLRRRLNPRFVEWLMGFPIGWTEL
jgi:hypothetical protein